MKAKLLASIACIALMSCKPTAPTASWGDFTKAQIDQWFAIDPAYAVYEGAHQFDGKLPDWSASGLKARTTFLHKLIDDATAYDSLTGADAFERDYLVQVARKELFWIEDADLPHTNPAWYINGGLDPNVYVSREYADKPTRMKAMIAFFEEIPQAAKNIRANLKTPLPASFVKLGVAGFGGFADYYKVDARTAFADVKDPELQAQFAAASENAAAAMTGLRDWLEAQEGSATQDYALGGERFSRMLKATEAVDTPLDELERAGRADLVRNQQAMAAACAQFTPGASIPDCLIEFASHKPVGGPVAAATRRIPELTAFVRAHDLVTIPGTEQALVRESPPYNRQNSAYMDPPAPLEKRGSSIYYITPPDPSWPQAKQDTYVPADKHLIFTTAHEVMPGHFIQFLHSNRSTSMVGRLFVSYSFAEGWAHYTEEMMWDEGLGNGDPEFHIGQLSKALLRNCRYLSAIGLHARGMTQEQAATMIREECYQDAGTADQQAARGTYDPAYLNYTLGKLMIRKLRDDWTASRGGHKALKEFHDTLLSFGGPPIPLVRRAMMGEDKPKAVF